MLPVRPLAEVALELANSVSFDVNGALIGPNMWAGGHGGLVSDKTIALADETRRAIEREKVQCPTPSS